MTRHLLWSGGHLVWKSGHLVWTDDPSGCSCCGSPPATCGGCTTTPPTVTVDVSGVTDPNGTHCDLWNGSYTLPQCATDSCVYTLTFSPGAPLATTWQISCEIFYFAGKLSLTVVLGNQPSPGCTPFNVLEAIYDNGFGATVPDCTGNSALPVTFNVGLSSAPALANCVGGQSGATVTVST